MPELRLRAIELGSFFIEVSAAALHMAHWASESKGRINRIMANKKIWKYWNFCTIEYETKISVSGLPAKRKLSLPIAIGRQAGFKLQVSSSGCATRLSRSRA